MSINKKTNEVTFFIVDKNSESGYKLQPPNWFWFVLSLGLISFIGFIFSIINNFISIELGIYFLLLVVMFFSAKKYLTNKNIPINTNTLIPLFLYYVGFLALVGLLFYILFILL